MPQLSEHSPSAPRVPPSKSTPRRAVPSPSGALRAKALEVHRRLGEVFGLPIPYFHSLDPLSELVSSLLSHRTRNAESGRAFKALRARFPDWSDLVDADTCEVEALIQGVTWPEAKAPRIQQVLADVRARHGALMLDFLADMEAEQARAWLAAIPGVGPKTSAAVLSFSTLRMPALPVDSHHHRVAQRLGLIGPKVDVGPSHDLLRALLPADYTAQELYDDHELLMLHGQKTCHFRGPACGRCPLLDLCPTGQARGA